LRKLHLDRMADGAPSIETDCQLTRAALDSEPPLQYVCLHAWRGGRLIFECLYLPLARRSLHQSAAPLILSAMQTTHSVASQSSVDQLARARRPMRTLQRKNSVSLFRGGTRYRASVPGDLAKVPMAGGDGVLDLCFVPDHRNVHRF